MEALTQEKLLQMFLSADNTAHGYDPAAYARMRVDAYNAAVGSLTDYDCPLCKNKGYIQYVGKGGEEITRECRCMPIRETKRVIRESGLQSLLDRCTFDAYRTDEPWQKSAKAAAQRFVTDHKDKWFFAGGQVGCGKTHLCTAIVREFLLNGIRAKYMLWRDEITGLKAIVMEDGYSGAITGIKQMPVLYIDDFFKSERGKPPTTADVNIAFEILNYRYNNPELITLISSELTVDDILQIDQAIGSRIYERCRDSCLCIGRDTKKNYRLRQRSNGT